MKLLLHGPLEIFSSAGNSKNFSDNSKKFSAKIRLKIFRDGSDRKISGQAPPVPAETGGWPVLAGENATVGRCGGKGLISHNRHAGEERVVGA